MSKTILEEAMEDAKILKETAIQNAQNVLVEAISPKIKEFVENQLGEGDLEENMYETEGEGEMPAPEPEEEEEMEMPEEGLWTEGEECPKDDDLDESAEEVVEITQEDLRKAFNEMVAGQVQEATVSSNFGDVEDPTPKTAGGKMQTGIADEKMAGDTEWSDSPGKAEPPAAEDWTVESLHKAYKAKLAEAVKVIKGLQNENKEYKKAAMFLKRNLQEVNLFNSKLLYTNKLLQSVDLSNKQRVSVIEAFDRAQTLREVELTYKNISESLKIAGVLGESKTKRPKSSRYMGNSGTSKVLEESVKREAGETWADRMQRLSGITE
jgi:hypothetical protein